MNKLTLILVFTLVIILTQIVMLAMGLEYCVLGDMHDMLYITTLTLLLASLIMILFMRINLDDIKWFLGNQIFITILLSVIYIAPYYFVLNLYPFTVMLIVILVCCALNVSELYKVMGER
jgi:hypothetical protein|tara:strand:- start:165 stop:524 length:360 start_codon:yes stop_codon:yes gene_type:complete